MASFFSGHAARLGLACVRILITEFQSADHRQNMLRSEMTREPSQQTYARTRRIRWYNRAVCPQQICPFRRVTFLGIGEPLEYLRSFRIFFRACHCSVERNAVL